MSTTIHKNFSIAAYFIFAAAASGLAGFFIYNGKSSGEEVSYAAETALLLVIFGYFALLGKDWLKWVLSFVSVLGLLALPPVIDNFNSNPLHAILVMLQSLLSFIAFVFLLLAPKGKE